MPENKSWLQNINLMKTGNSVLLYFFSKSKSYYQDIIIISKQQP